MRNFESKHPRARDGKFTEKLRKESGMTLELEDQPFTPPSTPRLYERGEIVAGKVISRSKKGKRATVTKYATPEYENIAPGQWHLEQVREVKGGATAVFYRSRGGGIAEIYRADGTLSDCHTGDKNRMTKNSKAWNEDGVLTYVENFYTKEEILEEVNKNGEYLERARNDEIGKPIEKTVILGRGVDADGNTKLVRIEYSYDEEDEDGNKMHTAREVEL